VPPCLPVSKWPLERSRWTGLACRCRDNLPYIECIIKEALRWYPVAPLGVPHRLMEDDYHGSCWIPADPTILPNIWAKSRDETMYKDPETFSPESFGGDLGKEILDPRSFIFDFGRRRDTSLRRLYLVLSIRPDSHFISRICIGLHFADTPLYIAITYILATFSILKARDENGHKIEPKVTFSSGLTSHANPWQCDILPRSSRATRLVLGERGELFT